MKVAIDLDGVIADIFPVIRDIIIQKGKSFEHTGYHPEIHGVSNSRDFVAPIIDHVLSNQMLIKPYNDIMYIHSIDRYLGPITFVTARRKDFNDETLKWIDRHFPNLSYSFINKRSKDKPEFLKKEGFDLFVEDRLRTANKSADLGINIFLINRYWNLGRYTHEKVIRVGNLGTFFSVAITKFFK